jgi:hypothetical protein
MKAPIKIRIGEPEPKPPAQSGLREWQLEALRYCRDHTNSNDQYRRMIVALNAMGEQQ